MGEAHIEGSLLIILQNMLLDQGREAAQAATDAIIAYAQQAQDQQIKQLKAHIDDQEQEIKQHLGVIAELKYQINLEWRFLMDTQPRGLLPFLRKQPATPFIQKVLADQQLVRLHNQAARGTYDRILRFRLHCNEEEMEEFKQLWKLLMLSTYSDDL
jgi:hypothetical protein